MNNMEKVFSQEDFDEIMANVGSQGESYVTIETKTLAEFAAYRSFCRMIFCTCCQ